MADVGTFILTPDKANALRDVESILLDLEEIE
jgi:hypothetical protein